jgi:tetratricopeptide (TPR) repeat protein
MAMKTIDFSYFIERYNTGEMDTMEKNWFVKELEGNTKLQQEVLLRKRVDDCLVKHDLTDLRKKLANLEKTRREKVTVGDGKKAAITRFAAAIAVLMLLGILYYLMSGGPGDPGKVYQANFNPYVYSGTSRAVVKDDDLTFKSAIDIYNAGDYRTAATALQKYLYQNPGKTEAYFLLGISEMENNHFDNAINILNELCESKSNLYLDHSQWYLALCYVKTGNYDGAANKLQAIINSGSYYKSKARKVLKKIK